MVDNKAARDLCALVSDHGTRKYGGKTLSLEQFVLRRANAFAKDPRFRPVLPGLEMIYLFYGFPVMANEQLQEAARAVAARKRQLADDFSQEQEEDFRVYLWENTSVCDLLYACLLKHIGHKMESEKLLVKLASLNDELKQETYVVPFARFELGALYLELTELSVSGAKVASSELLRSSSLKNLESPRKSVMAKSRSIEDLFKKAEYYLRYAKGYKTFDYNFKVRLHFRIHLALKELEVIRVQKNIHFESLPVDDDDSDPTVAAAAKAFALASGRQQHPEFSRSQSQSSKSLSPSQSQSR